MRIVVVGGGVIGLASAYYLDRSDADVVVVEASDCGGGASAANAGWVCPALSFPVPAPGVFAQAIRFAVRPSASPLFVRPSARPSFVRWLREFRRACSASRFYAGLEATLPLAMQTPQLLDEMSLAGISFDAYNSGLLVGVLSEDSLEHYDRLFSGLSDVGYSGQVIVLDRANLSRVEPAFSEAVVGGVLLPNERVLRGESLVAGLKQHLEARGVPVLEHMRVDALYRDGQKWKVVLGAAEYSADSIVVAAGAGTSSILGTVGFRLLLESARGFSSTSAGTGTRPRTALYMPEMKVGLTPLSDEVRLVGGFELGVQQAVVKSRRVARIAEVWAQCLSDWRPTEPIRHWAGLRPMSPDSVPYIGEVPGRPGLFVATGHGMLGLTLAPATGSLISSLILDEDRILDPSAFAADRFARGSRF